ncbi:transposase [Bradyrhizobium sp. RDM12]
MSDALEGMKATVAKVLKCSWQRCCFDFVRNALAHAARPDGASSPAFLAKAFAQDDAEAGTTQWRKVADQFRPKLPKLAAFLDAAETDVLAYTTSRRSTVPSCTPRIIERLKGEIKRRNEVPGIFPNENAIVRLISAILLEQNDEWAVPCARYMTMEAVAPLSDDPSVSLTALAS